MAVRKIENADDSEGEPVIDSVGIHAQTDEQVKIPAFWFHSAGAMHCSIQLTDNTTLYLEHWQLVDFRDQLSQAIATSPVKCHFPDCEEEHEKRTCIACDRKGCDEHMRTVFCGDTDEVDGSHCDPACPVAPNGYRQ